VIANRIKIALGVAAAGVVGAGTMAVASDGGGDRETLTGYEEVPALSTPGVGDFRTSISRSRDEIRYTLTFSDLESDVTQAHIHFENRTNNGPIVVFLCTNLGNGTAGTQACPAGGGTITGTITPADISASAASAGAVAAGIGVGEFDEFVRAIRAGATYVNVHSVGRPGGEVRAQLEDEHHHSG
jgi:CHRD domain